MRMNWMKRITSYAATILICLCFASAYAQSYGTAVIDAGNAGKLHLRSEPSSDSASKGLYFTGTEVICKSDPNADWVKVLVGAQSGYMKSEYLKTEQEVQPVRSIRPYGVVTVKDGVNLRHGPTMNAEKIVTIRNGEAVRVLGETIGHWYWVEYRDWNGYVRSDLIELRESDPADNLLSGIWIHSSGAGAWKTEVTVYADLSFDGSYTDSNMEPKIKYETEFYGRFSELEKIDELTYRTKIKQLDYVGEPGVQFVDGVMIITNEPAGIEKDAQYILYLPGTAERRLRDAERNWPHESENGVLTNVYLCEASSGRGFSLVQKH